MNVKILKVVAFVGCLLASTGGALAFNDTVIANADVIEKQTPLSKIFSNAMSNDDYGVCVHAHIYAMLLDVRGGLPDNIAVLWELIGRGLVDYRGNHLSNGGSQAYLDAIITSADARFDTDKIGFSKYCTDLLTAPLR